MRSTRIFFLIFVLALLMLLPTATLASETTPDQTILGLIPGDGIYQPGDSFMVEVYVADIDDLYAADIQLTFDPALFAVIDANSAQSGIQVMPRNDLLWPDLVIKKEADNDAGTIWYAVTQLNPRPPASGSGALFAFEIEALQTGNTAISFSNQQLSTRDAELIPVTTTDGQYQIGTISSSHRLSLPSILFNH